MNIEPHVPSSKLVRPPVHRLAVLLKESHAQHRLLEGLGTRHPIHQVPVKELHEHACALVWNAPQGGQDGLGTRHKERPAHPLHPVCPHSATPTVTVAQDNEPRPHSEPLHLVGKKEHRLVVAPLPALRRGYDILGNGVLPRKGQEPAHCAPVRCHVDDLCPLQHGHHQRLGGVLVQDGRGMRDVPHPPGLLGGVGESPQGPLLPCVSEGGDGRVPNDAELVI